jgi:hypothetical protein
MLVLIRLWDCMRSRLTNSDAMGDGDEHRAQRVRAARRLGLYVPPHCRRGRPPTPLGHTMIVQIKAPRRLGTLTLPQVLCLSVDYANLVFAMVVVAVNTLRSDSLRCPPLMY